MKFPLTFYQRRGLLAEPRRELGGLRYYDDAFIERIRFIKRAQAIGFSLEEIMGLLTLQQSDACAKTHEAAEKKLEIVETKIRDLLHIRATLKELVGKCRDIAGSPCPIVESLLHDETLDLR